jgi:hypothetical protein
VVAAAAVQHKKPAQAGFFVIQKALVCPIIIENSRFSMLD